MRTMPARVASMRKSQNKFDGVYAGQQCGRRLLHSVSLAPFWCPVFRGWNSRQRIHICPCIFLSSTFDLNDSKKSRILVVSTGSLQNGQHIDALCYFSNGHWAFHSFHWAFSSMMALTSEFLFILLAMYGMTLALPSLKSSLLMSLCAS